MKKVIAMLLIAVLFGGISPASCLAYEPLRVAILPVSNSSYTHNQDVERVIADSLHARFHMPLDKVITLYDVVPDNEVDKAMPQELRNRNKPGEISASVLKKIGAKLNADVVIGAQIMDFREYTFTNIWGDLLQETDLTIRLVGYDIKKNQYLDIHESRNYNGEYSVLGNSDYLAKLIMDNLIAKVPYTWKK